MAARAENYAAPRFCVLGNDINNRFSSSSFQTRHSARLRTSSSCVVNDSSLGWVQICGRCPLVTRYGDTSHAWKVARQSHRVINRYHHLVIKPGSIIDTGKCARAVFSKPPRSETERELRVGSPRVMHRKQFSAKRSCTVMSFFCFFPAYGQTVTTGAKKPNLLRRIRARARRNT